MEDTIPKWYADLLHELLLHGKSEIEFPIIGKTTFIAAGNLGDYIVVFPDGTRWSSTEYVRRVMEE